MRRSLGVVILLLVAGACSGGGAGSLPNESIPPVPAAPPGWAMVVAFGSAGEGAVSTNVDMDSAGTAIHAACTGLGRLVVQFGEGSPAPAVVFECGSHGLSSDSWFEVTNIGISGRTTVIASVIEDPAILVHPAFNVAVERRQP